MNFLKNLISDLTEDISQKEYLLESNKLIIENDEKKQRYYKYKKNRFGKYKLIQVTEKEAYTFWIDKNSFIIPEVKGYHFESYLMNKVKYDLKNGISESGKRIFSKITNFEKDFKEVYTSEGKLSYKGNVSFSLSLYDENENCISEGFFMSISNANYFVDVTKDFYENLFSCCFSGIYCTSRMRDRYNQIVVNNSISFKNEKEKPPLYFCEECEEKFHNLDELFCHLIETKHKDSILDSYPYDEEIKRIKELIDRD